MKAKTVSNIPEIDSKLHSSASNYQQAPKIAFSGRKTIIFRPKKRLLTPGTLWDTARPGAGGLGQNPSAGGAQRTQCLQAQVSVSFCNTNRPTGGAKTVRFRFDDNNRV